MLYDKMVRGGAGLCSIFKNTYQPEWLTEPMSRAMIKDVDKSEVVGPALIQSPVLGAIPPERLSGGVKTLILIWHVPDKIFNARNCGDNPARRTAMQDFLCLMRKYSRD